MDSYVSGTIEPPDPELGELLRAVARSPRSRRVPRDGEVIGGRYRIEELRGRGGMGVVFAAKDLRTEKRVALKWIDSESLGETAADRAALERTLREARLASRIRHPNVVEVHDVSVEDGTPYLVMELLEGETLRDRLERGPLGWDEAIGLLRPAMSGVAALHSEGIVHRDLKPDNLFVRRAASGEPPSVKIIDLGISRGALEESASHTRTGTALGTPAYMPLEQLRDARRAGPAADIYALGVVLYESLAGTRPFEARSAADHAVVIATSRPRPIARRVPGLTPRRIAAIMKALEREPERRFASVDEFLEAIEGNAPDRGRTLAIRTLAVLVAIGVCVTTTRSLRAPTDSGRRSLPEREAIVDRRSSDLPETRNSGGTPPESGDIAVHGVDDPPTVSADGLGSRRRRRDPPAASPPAPVPQPAEESLDRATTLRPEDF